MRISKEHKHTTPSSPWGRQGRGLLLPLLVLFCFYSCARMGNPDGGWFDETPPHVVSASPSERATGVKSNRVTIYFDEFIKLENASENVVISPAQLEQPEIKATGKRIVVELKDSLKENTTYTIDFSDAITDNNEGNPLGNYTYVFSTGNRIDSMEVSGYVLNAQDLEPIKGSLVGLYTNHADSAFLKEPMLRVGRTDGNGRFVIRGVAPGEYRIYALEDADGDLMLSQRSERLAFTHDIIVPSSKPDIRQDTIWKDSLHISDIQRTPYTHYLPDDIVLRAFVQKETNRQMLKIERSNPIPDHLTFYFTAGHDSLPKLRILSRDTIDGSLHDRDSISLRQPWIIEHSEKKDTVTYWLNDSSLVNNDTLNIEASYFMTDTLGCLVMQTDTLEFLAKTSYEKRLKDRQEEMAKYEKAVEKAKKKGNEPPPAPEHNVLEPKWDIPGSMAPNQDVGIAFPTPLAQIDSAKINLYVKHDTLWYRAAYQLTSENLPPRQYKLLAEWRPGLEYSLEVDSAAFTDIYGNVSKERKSGINILDTSKFGSLFVNIALDSAIVQLLDKSEKVIAEQHAVDGTAEFYYIKEGDYYIRAFSDRNGNGVWDTGEYSADEQAEEVYYYNKVVPIKEKRDVTTDFNIHAVPLYRQKPADLVKQKGDKKKTIKNQNAKRAADLGITYIPKDKAIEEKVKDKNLKKAKKAAKEITAEVIGTDNIEIIETTK